MNEQLDPRIHKELERLNEASNEINRIENKLNDTRNEYRSALSESTTQLNILSKKLGDCVAKARPFYDAKQAAKEAQMETQVAAVRFERAVSMHSAAREMVAVAEQGMEKGGTNTTDTAWQEMLNHATAKVNEAEVERLLSGEEHQRTMEVFKKAEGHMNSLQRKLKFNIMKSRKYFELKDQTQNKIQALVNAVNSAEEKLHQAKLNYSQALKNLESISEAIHAQRKSEREALGERGTGVGAEEEPRYEEDVTVEEGKPDTVPEKISESGGQNTEKSEIKLNEKLHGNSPSPKSSEILLSVAGLGLNSVS